MNIFGRSAVALLLGVSVLLFSACSQTSDTPEEQIGAYITAAETAAKERDPLAIKSLIAQSYRDELGRNRQNLVSLATGYLLRNKNIHTLTHIRQLTFPQPDRAELVLVAGFAGEQVSDMETLLSLQATIYLFNLTLAKEDEDWRLTSASWRRATSEDIFRSN